jgi:HPt (histidine-containing phosphotransfer) domain-containing protein
MNQSFGSQEARQRTIEDTLGLNLKVIQARFLETLEDRVTELRRHKNEIVGNSNVAASLKAISDMVHKIAGVAATLGFPLAGTLAAGVESNIYESGLDGVSPEDAWRRVSPSFDRLLEELDRLRAL